MPSGEDAPLSVAWNFLTSAGGPKIKEVPVSMYAVRPETPACVVPVPMLAMVRAQSPGELGATG